MYSTCLFCQHSLGKNEAVEHFPVGRRLAFDAAKGRLWVVCRKCERWNLTPLEERWEAIDECERAFRATKLRVSTDHIGLARLKEGMELVRIGDPQRPEMAAWRYGDQFGRRRRRQVALVGGAAAVVGGVVLFGPILGLIGVGALTPALQLMGTGRSLYAARKLIRIPAPNGETRKVRLSELWKTQLFADGDDITLRVIAIRTGPSPSPWKFDSRREEIDLTGDDAIRAAAALLPMMNRGGGDSGEVARAVGILEETTDPRQLFQRAVGAIETREKSRLISVRSSNLLRTLPTAGRLALEMATHEESERRALEGELNVLEAAWKDAEEIASIADDMFLPPSVEEDLARLKNQRKQ
ncbi:MAG: hypothetical protein ABI969_10075 [bacterium]